MESVTRLAWFDPNGARLSLPRASLTLRPILVLEGRPIARQSDRPHGEARSAYATLTLRSRRPVTGADHEPVFVPFAPSIAVDLGASGRTGLDDAGALQSARFFLCSSTVEKTVFTIEEPWRRKLTAILVFGRVAERAVGSLSPPLA